MVDFLDTKRLIRDESNTLLPLGTRGAGTYNVKVDIQGNSILSTVFVESLDGGASVEVKWFDFTTGFAVGEANLLKTHNVVSTALTSDRTLVANTHDKPYVSAVVTGGSVKFSVYATVVSSTASDLADSLFLEGDTVNLLQDKGIALACRNETTGLWELVKCPFPVALEESGTPFYVDVTGTTTPGTEQTIMDFTVGAGKTRNLSRLNGSLRQPSFYKVEIDGSIVGTGFTGAANIQPAYEWNPRRPATAGKNVKVKLKQISGSPACDFGFHLMGSES